MIVLSAKRRRAILVATCTALIALVASASGLNAAQHDLALDLNASFCGPGGRGFESPRSP
jgi:uncharacterized heparinase superfamily protein